MRLLIGKMKTNFTITLALACCGLMMAGCQKKHESQLSMKIVLTPLNGGEETCFINGGTYISSGPSVIEIVVTDLNP